MAFARHNIEKHRLIELVRLNPILWDCRLPHYKRSDKKKDVKWCELGRVFNVSGDRVQRTFTSLREIFRRELNNEKLLGDRFTSKWEYYDAMCFLKDVIRERKTKERGKPIEDEKEKELKEEYAFYPPHRNSSCLSIQPDVIINDSPSPQPVPENIPSRSTSPSTRISIKEEYTEPDSDRPGNIDSISTRNAYRPPHVNLHEGSRSFPIIATVSGSNSQKPNAKDSSGFYAKLDNDAIDRSDVFRQTPREILHVKFGEFLTARLNAMHETDASNLMNRILLLIAEN